MTTNDELREQIQNVLIKDYGPEITIVLGDTIIDQLMSLIEQHEAKAVLAARQDELKRFELPVYDHTKCPEPMTCIGYENARSDFDNEKELRQAALQQEAQKGKRE